MHFELYLNVFLQGDAQRRHKRALHYKSDELESASVSVGANVVDMTKLKGRCQVWVDFEQLILLFEKAFRLNK